MGLRHAAAACVLLAGGCAAARTAPTHLATNSLDDITCFDEAIWSVDGDELVFTEGSTYTPPHRSPRAIALFPMLVGGSYVIEVQAQQTGRDYGHRDLCVFFDWQNPAQFGYCHLATEADPNSHHIQIVDNTQRTPCTTWRTEGVDWGRGNWHDLRIERDGNAGTIRAFFDGDLVLEGADTRFSGGRIGLGSFDDQGRFRNLRVSPLE